MSPTGPGKDLEGPRVSRAGPIPRPPGSEPKAKGSAQPGTYHAEALSVPKTLSRVFRFLQPEPGDLETVATSDKALASLVL